MDRRRRRPERSGFVGRAERFLTRGIWLQDLGGMPTLRALATRLVRVCVIAVRGFLRDDCMQRAAALTYITIFSLVPSLAMAFALAKGFGGFDDDLVQRGLESTFGPQEIEVEGAESVGNPLREAADKVYHLVRETDLQLLGTFGLVILLLALIRMFGAAEGALNEIWGVKRRRTLVRRLTDYLAIAIVTPLLLTTGAGLATYLRTREIEFLPGETMSLTPLLTPLSWLLPCLGMTFVLIALPNTNVKLPSALIGGLVAGVLWQLVQGVYFEGQAGLTRYSKVYSTFAFVPMLLLWIYFSWTTVLAGAEVAYAHHSEPIYTSMQRSRNVDGRYREALAPRLAARVARAFLDGQLPPTAAELATDLGIPPRVVVDVLEALVDHGLLARTSEEEEAEGYVLARDPARVSMLDLLRALRRVPNADAPPVAAVFDGQVDRLLGDWEDEQERSAHNLSLSELAARFEAARQVNADGRISAS